MAGVKGRSGRQPWSREKEIIALWNLSIPVLKKALAKGSITPETRKIEIALELVKKMIPSEWKGDPSTVVHIRMGHTQDEIKARHQPVLSSFDPESNGRD